MSNFPSQRKIRFNRTLVSADFLPQEADRQGRLGFGWAEHFTPYRAFALGGNPSPFSATATARAPKRSDTSATLGATNFGPFGSTNFGPFGSYSRQVGFGYHPDLPDMRDYCLGPIGKTIQPSLDKVIKGVVHGIQQASNQQSEAAGGKKGKSNDSNSLPSFLLGESAKLPTRYDLRATGLLSPVEDQGPLGSCTAQAAVGLIEYLMRAGGGDGRDMSRLFLYKLSRRLLNWEGDTGAYLRTAIKAVALFGLPPECEWPYVIERYNDEPLAYHFAYAQNFKATTYARLDGYGDGDATLDTVKRCLADGFPVAFGFPVYSSIDEVGTGGNYVIPLPGSQDNLIGGHAVLAVGFNDDLPVGTPSGATTSRKLKGALLIRNSWGQEWGVDGYAYLPYEYVRRLWAVDFWTVFNEDWLKLESFD